MYCWYPVIADARNFQIPAVAKISAPARQTCAILAACQPPHGGLELEELVAADAGALVADVAMDEDDGDGGVDQDDVVALAFQGGAVGDSQQFLGLFAGQPIPPPGSLLPNVGDVGQAGRLLRSDHVVPPGLADACRGESSQNRSSLIRVQRLPINPQLPSRLDTKITACYERSMPQATPARLST